MKRIVGASLIAVTSAFILSTVWAADSDNPQDDVARVEAVANAIIAADNRSDHATVMSLYADNAILISPSGPDVVGIDAISEHYANIFAQSTLAIDNDIVETVVSGDWAISRGTNRVIATRKSDGQRTVGHAKYLMTLHRNAERGWLIVHLIWSNQDGETPETRQK